MSLENTALLSVTLKSQLTFGRRCFHRYKARTSLNRYVVLILLWNWLIWLTVGVFTSGKDDTDLVSVVTTVQPYTYNSVDYLLHRLLPSIFCGATAIISVWLTGWKYKLPSIMLAGTSVLYLGVFLDTVVHTAAFASGSEDQDYWVKALLLVAKLIIAMGTGPCVVNIIQLAMEQIPGASFDQLSSIISWIIFTSTLGTWLNFFIKGVYTYCAESPTNKAYLPISKLGMTILMTVVLATNCLYQFKLLDYSPASNSAKQIYDVLKYAIRNKYPQSGAIRAHKGLSRLDHGKRMCGGPFTIEEVEDVKTFLRILGLCIATFIYLTILYFNGYSLTFFNNDDHNHSIHFTNSSSHKCTTFITFSFTGQNLWWLLIFTLLYELICIPVLNFRMPKMLFRVGIAAVIAASIGVVQTAFFLYDLYGKKETIINPIGPQTALAVAIGVSRTIYYTAGLEFICAQSPYAMRSFFITVAFFIIAFSPAVSGLIFTLWKNRCMHKNCSVIYTVGVLFISIVALVIYCIFAKRYRKRSREEIEEINGDTISIT